MAAFLPTAEEFVSRMPVTAQKDFLEWTPPKTDLVEMVREQILKEVKFDRMLASAEKVFITDDRPRNEYFLLGRSLD